MLGLSDFITGRKRFFNLSRGLCISASKHCWKMKFRIHVHVMFHCYVHVMFMLSWLSDFVVCSTSINIWSSVVYI